MQGKTCHKCDCELGYDEKQTFTLCSYHGNLCMKCINRWHEYITGQDSWHNLMKIQAHIDHFELMKDPTKSVNDYVDLVEKKDRTIRHLFFVAKKWIAKKEPTKVENEEVTAESTPA